MVDVSLLIAKNVPKAFAQIKNVLESVSLETTVSGEYDPNSLRRIDNTSTSTIEGFPGRYKAHELSDGVNPTDIKFLVEGVNLAGVTVLPDQSKIRRADGSLWLVKNVTWLTANSVAILQLRSHA